MLKKDNRLEIRISSEDLKKINFLVRRFGFNSRSQLLIHLIDSALMGYGK
jgi:predicted DNA binding CopG/RHH family protein